MNTEIVERLSTYIAKLTMAQVILTTTQPIDKAKTIIKDLTGIDIDNLEAQLTTNN